jgi:hypothetical protein
MDMKRKKGFKGEKELLWLVATPVKVSFFIQIYNMLLFYFLFLA